MLNLTFVLWTLVFPYTEGKELDFPYKEGKELDFPYKEGKELDWQVQEEEATVVEVNGRCICGCASSCLRWGPVIGSSSSSCSG